MKIVVMKFLKWLRHHRFIADYCLFPGSTTIFSQISNLSFPAVPAGSAIQLEKYVSDHEALHKLKPDNEARIIWLE